MTVMNHRAEGRVAGDPLVLIDDATVQQLARDVGIHRLGDVLGAFADELVRRIPIVQSAVAARDLEVLGRESHSIKGSAMTFGAPALAAAASRANDAFRIADNAAVLAAGRELLEWLPLTCAAVAQLIEATKTKGDSR